MLKYLKIISLFIALNFINKANAHLVWTCKSDSTVSYKWQNGLWIPFEKKISLFDFNGNLIEETIKGFDDISFSWINVSQSNYEYINNDNDYHKTLELNLSWNSTEWDSISKIEYFYTPLFNLEQKTTSNWNNGWIYENNQTWISPDDNQDESYIIQNWNNNAWENSYKLVRQFDSSHNKTLEETYNWNSLLTNWEGSAKQIFNYTNNLKTSEELQFWEVNDWVQIKLDLFQYDASSNNTQRLVQKYENNSWQNSIKYDFTYSNNKETSRYKLVWDTLNNIWLEDFKFLSTYDLNMNLTQAESYKMIDSSWFGLFKNSKVYNVDNLEISDFAYQWDNVNKTWNNFQFTNTEYNNNSTFITLMNWDNLNSDWLEDAQEIITVDDNSNLISNSTYDWVNNNWFPLSKDSFQYDNYNNETLEINYSWNEINQEWEGKDKLETVLHRFKISSESPLVDCNQDSVVLISSNNSILSNTWLENSNEIGETSFDLKVENTGEYNVLIRDQYCTYQSDSVLVKIGELPIVPIVIQEGDMLSTQNNELVNWYFNGELVLENSSQLQIIDIGDYWIEIIDTNTLCSSTSEILNITTNVSENYDFKLSVNPSLLRDQSLIEIPENLTYDSEVQIYNSAGQLISTFKNLKSDILIYRRCFFPGLYFVTFKNNSQILKAKFIVN